MLKSEWDNVHRILAVRLDNIGDVIMTGPALRCLKEALPEARITLMASPAGSQAAPLLPWVDDILVWRAVWQDASWTMPLDPARELSLVETLRSGDFDAAVIFTSFSQSPYPPAYACYLAGIPIRLGHSKEFGGSLLSHWRTPPPDGGYQVDRNLSLLESVDFPVRSRRMELNLPQEIYSQADRLLQGCGIGAGEPFVLLAPGASCSSRRYDPRRFAEVSDLLQEETGLPVVLAGSAREQKLVEPFLTARRPPRSLVGRTSLAEMVAVLGRSALVIANNSAPIHIAEALLRPMVILYSGTELVDEWAPRYAPHRILNRPVHCSPCRRFQCAYNMECLEFTPEEVAAEAVELLRVVGTAGTGAAKSTTIPIL